MYREEDMNLSLILFSEFCTSEEQELWRFHYMKGVVGDSNQIYFLFFRAVVYF
jgi:hypothetical protein